jgi:hypothetical protein
MSKDPPLWEPFTKDYKASTMMFTIISTSYFITHDTSTSLGNNTK